MCNHQTYVPCYIASLLRQYIVTHCIVINLISFHVLLQYYISPSLQFVYDIKVITSIPMPFRKRLMRITLHEMLQLLCSENHTIHSINPHFLSWERTRHYDSLLHYDNTDVMKQINVSKAYMNFMLLRIKYWWRNWKIMQTVSCVY